MDRLAMNKNTSAQPASAPRQARRSLADLVAHPAPSATVEEQPAPVSSGGGARPLPSGRAKYPSATVYLPRRAVRLIKEIGLEEDRRISDIIADAVDEYLQKRGHPSLEQLAEQVR